MNTYTVRTTDGWFLAEKGRRVAEYPDATLFTSLRAARAFARMSTRAGEALVVVENYGQEDECKVWSAV